MTKVKNPFGDGYASQRIVNGILYFLEKLIKTEEF